MALEPLLPPDLHLSEQAYLSAEFEVTPDFVDGTLEERNVGEYDHSSWLGALLAWFRQHHQKWHLRALLGWRLHVPPTRYRVADIAVLTTDLPREGACTTPPAAVFEILSPDDTLRRTVLKLQDYEHMGIRNILVIDPEGPLFFRFQNGTLGPAEAAFDLTGAPGRVDWQAIQALIY